MKKLLLFFCLLPALLMAETPINNCILENECDSLTQETALSRPEPPVMQAPAAIAPDKPDDKPITPYDWKKNGLFQALFHVGCNFAQIDGDGYNGYNKLGFDGGVGVQVRFHKFFSASAEINYTQWGAKRSIIANANDTLGQRYLVKLDYIQIPLSINVMDKEIIMFSAGLNLSFLARYYERDYKGLNITDTIQPQPKKFDLDAFAAVHFIIKQQFGIGLKFSYSMLPFRGIEPFYASTTRIYGQYNNVLTVRFMYILSAWKKK
jgi:Outer membrane protein beta-barrel domain